MEKNVQAEGIVVAELHVFDDGCYEFTGKTVSANSGPFEFNDNSLLIEHIINFANHEFGDDWKGIQFMGYRNGVYIKSS